MIIVHVHVRVKENSVELFKQATIENAKNSILEPGIVGFDILQQQDDSTRYLLVETYRDQDAMISHKNTTHYQKWRDTVAEMMAEARFSIKYNPIFP